MEGEQKRMLGFLRILEQVKVDLPVQMHIKCIECLNSKTPKVRFEPGIFFSCAYHFGGDAKRDSQSTVVCWNGN